MSNNTIKMTTSEIGKRLSAIYEEHFKSVYAYHNKLTRVKGCYLEYYTNEKELFSDKLVQVVSFRNITSRLIGKKYISELFDVTEGFVLLSFDFEINTAIQTLNSLNLKNYIEVPRSDGQFLKQFAFFKFVDTKTLLL